ncbi:hypothetical protein Tcan_05629 [Toxocara canis]|nr:hypothetical protein Tcan_05629 [Toxocara canis]
MYALISASALGTLLHPLMLWLLIDKFDARLFVALNFLAIILLVLLFVSVVNMQDQLEATEGKRNGFMWFVWHFLSGGGYGTRKTLRTRVQRLSQRITRLRPTSFNRASLYRFRPGSFNGASFYRIRQNRLKPLRINHPTPAPPFRTQCKVGFRQRPPSSQLPRQKVVVNTDENDSNRVDPGMSHTNNSSVNPTVHSCKQYSSSGETDMIAEESSQL